MSHQSIRTAAAWTILALLSLSLTLGAGIACTGGSEDDDVGGAYWSGPKVWEPVDIASLERVLPATGCTACPAPA